MSVQRGYSDFEKLLAFENGIFKLNFKKTLPKVYSDERFLNDHYTISENGELAAACVAYPTDYAVGGEVLKGACIGGVGVAKAHRGKGLMGELLTFVADDFKKNGGDFLFLSGHRQRYEHFGFTPAGYRVILEFDAYNLAYVEKFCDLDYTFEPFCQSHVDAAFELYEKKPLRVIRRKDLFYKTLMTWRWVKPFAAFKKGVFKGFFVFGRAVDGLCCEPCDAPGIIAAFAKFIKSKKIEILFDSESDPCRKALAPYAEGFGFRHPFSLKILDFKRTAGAFLKQSVENSSGFTKFEAVFEAGDEKFSVSIDGKNSKVESSGKPADFKMNEIEATTRFFDPFCDNGLPFRLYFGISPIDFS